MTTTAQSTSDLVAETLTITSVGYSRLVNLGDYENEKVHANALVESGQDPGAVLQSLRAWVGQRLTDKRGERDRAYELAEHRSAVEFLERRASEIERKAKAAREFLERHGLEVKDWPDDLPF